MAAAPPDAARYLSKSESAEGREDLSGFLSSVGPASGLKFSSATIGVPTGCAAPRWHEKQVTSRLPSKLSLLMAFIISIILRAASFGFLSSLSKAIVRSLRTWQYSHSTPSDAVMNCMAG